MSVPLVPLLMLALLQGVMEYLPISSEGQLVLVAWNVFRIAPDTALTLAFWLHLGTAIAIVLFYRNDIFGPLFQSIHTDNPSAQSEHIESKKIFGPLFWFVIVGTLGTVLVALPLYFMLQVFVTQQWELLGETVSLTVGVLLLFTGVILYFQRGAGGTQLLGNLSLLEAFILGIVQGFAVLPGISRSGMTLTWLLLRGVERTESLRLSFLLSVPATFGLVGLDFLLGEFYWLSLPALAIIVLVPLVVGIGTLTALRQTALRAPFWAFCLAIGLVVTILEVPAILALAAAAS
ncbi:MAG: undecaprenyl-diphosphate phosphatase [Promethearchaeota archaeon]